MKIFIIYFLFLSCFYVVNFLYLEHAQFVPVCVFKLLGEIP
jgi:hypothetical protein